MAAHNVGDGVGAELGPLAHELALLLGLDAQAHHQPLGKVERHLGDL